MLGVWEGAHLLNSLPQNCQQFYTAPFLPKFRKKFSEKFKTSSRSALICTNFVVWPKSYHFKNIKPAYQCPVFQQIMDISYY